MRFTSLYITVIVLKFDNYNKIQNIKPVPVLEII